MSSRSAGYQENLPGFWIECFLTISSLIYFEGILEAPSRVGGKVKYKVLDARFHVDLDSK